MAISLVAGGALAGAVIDGGNVTITLPTLATGDVVYAWGGYSRATDITDPDGYSRIGDVTESSFRAFCLRKVMGATPDTEFVGPGSGNAQDAVVWAVFCLRGVDTGTPEDAAVVEVGNLSSSDARQADPIDTVTDGAWVLALAVARDNDTSVGTVDGYSNHVEDTENDTRDATLGGATVLKASAGTETPGAWSDWATTATWGAFTVAVRPASGATTHTLGQSDSLGLSDDVDRLANAARDIATNLGVSDDIDRIADALRAVESTLGLTDELFLAFVITLAIQDALGLRDDAVRSVEVFRTASGSLGISDSLLRTATALRAVAGSVGASDETARQASHFRQILESLGFSVEELLSLIAPPEAPGSLRRRVDYSGRLYRHAETARSHAARPETETAPRRRLDSGDDRRGRQDERVS